MNDRPAVAPRIVASLGARDRASIEADVDLVRPHADLIELRLDRIENLATTPLAELRRVIDHPAIATLRSRREGGEFDEEVADAAAILRDADSVGFEWIDLEADVAAAVARGNARRIVSRHGEVDHEPGATAARWVRELFALDADVVKVAATLGDPASALEFVQAAAREGKALGVPVTTIPMGRFGRYLRPLAGKFEMPLLYAAAHPSRRTAAGQLTLGEAIHLFRAGRISPNTRVFAVAGGNVYRSLSPAAHNAAFHATETDAIYVAIDADAFDQVATIARSLPLHGLSVTAPHKRSALSFADTASEAASRIGAANTLVRDVDGTFHADNTDAAGFMAGIDYALEHQAAARDLTVAKSFEFLRHLNGETSLSGTRPFRTALIYGTGGAARAIGFALRERGTQVFVTGRDLSSAATMVLALGSGIEAISPGRASSLTFDLLVKAVPDSEDDLPLDPFDFQPRGLAADVVYDPLDTNFLHAARRRGRTPVCGLAMFSEQAVLQAAAFTEQPPSQVRDAVIDGIVAGRRGFG